MSLACAAQSTRPCLLSTGRAPLHRHGGPSAIAGLPTVGPPRLEQDLVPIWRGGPMFYANQLGLSEVINKMSGFSELDEHFWKPAPLLKKLADESGAFGEAPAPEDRSELLSFKKANMGGV